MNGKNDKSAALFGAALAVLVLWLSLLAAGCCAPGRGLQDWITALNHALQTPYRITWTKYSLKAVIFCEACYGFAAMSWYSANRNRRPGEEHGSAVWGNVAQICAKYQDKKKRESNVILTEHLQIGMDGRKHRRNLNIMVVGGSGAGKTRFFCKPNIMQMCCSYIVCDPKGETLRALGPMFEARGIPISVLNLVDMSQSDGYNPFAYLRTDTDAIRLITNLIKNTTPKGANSSDPFWEKAETALLSAFVLYLMHEAPPEEQNFSMVMFMLENAAAREEDESYQSPVDLLFESLEEQEPDHIALKQYRAFKLGAGKTAKSILISAAVRLAAFNLPELVGITDHDNMDLAGLGESKRVIFAVTPDNDTSFNYIVGMLYTQAFQSLYYSADHVHGGRLPVHVRVIMDEFANIALPDSFEQILSTCRSREISCNIILQNIAQIKALFKDSWENLTGNCDVFLYLGGNEQGTHKYVSELLGKATIDTRTRGQTKGRNGSSSVNFQNAGRELLTPDEVRRLDNSKALVFVRGEQPIMDNKYDILKHPNIALTEDGGALPYRIPPTITDDLTYRPRLRQLETLKQQEELTEHETEEKSSAQPSDGAALQEDVSQIGGEHDADAHASDHSVCGG